jgi:hypothetical protein
MALQHTLFWAKLLAHTRNLRAARDDTSMQTAQNQGRLDLEAQAAFLIEWKHQLATLCPKVRKVLVADQLGRGVRAFNARVESLFRSRLQST